MQKATCAAGLDVPRWDIAIVGDILDERGRQGVSFAAANARQTAILKYLPDELQIDINGDRVSAEQIENYMLDNRGRRMVLETTTLGFVEVFLCCRAAKENGFGDVSLIYVEPGGYARPRRSQVLHKRAFELSGRVLGYRSFPWAARRLDDAREQFVVFFLGYEERRLERAMEDLQIRGERCYLVFGVPAFRAGWEMDAFANNIRVIRDRNMRCPIRFCGAENPASAYEGLVEVQQAVGKDADLFVAPVGTKPHGIGAALFAAENHEVGILYDHPARTAGRTADTHNWHLFTAIF